MSLEQYAYIAEIIAAIAVVGSIIYVGLQVKLNTRATESSTAQAFADAHNAFVGLINSSSELPDVLHRGAKGLSELEGADVIRFMAFHDEAFISLQTAYLQWKAKTLDERLWDSYRHSFVDLLTQAGQQDWWQLRRHWYDDEFQKYIDRAVETTEGKAMHPGAFST
jgi:hypothetical protein